MVLPAEIAIVVLYCAFLVNGFIGSQDQLLCSSPPAFFAKKHYHNSCFSARRFCLAAVVPPEDVSTSCEQRRQAMAAAAVAVAAGSSWPLLLVPSISTAAAAQDENMPNLQKDQLGKNKNIQIVRDPNSGYSAVVYTPPNSNAKKNQSLPVLLVLHGAGKNEQSGDASVLLDIRGEHAGLVPSLLYEAQAPTNLANNFVVAAPYVGQNKRSFYQEPRTKLLQFLDWFCQTTTNIDRRNVFLFGFSDGATVAVELATTRRFRGVVVASYGYSGPKLPDKALQLLRDIPFWIFHCQDDVIFDVAYSDRLVAALRSVNDENTNRADNADDSVIRYTRYERDPEGFTGSVRGHTTGITASKLPALYDWMLSYCDDDRV